MHCASERIHRRSCGRCGQRCAGRSSFTEDVGLANGVEGCGSNTTGRDLDFARTKLQTTHKVIRLVTGTKIAKVTKERERLATNAVDQDTRHPFAAENGRQEVLEQGVVDNFHAERTAALVLAKTKIGHVSVRTNLRALKRVLVQADIELGMTNCGHCRRGRSGSVNSLDNGVCCVLRSVCHFRFLAG